MGSAPPPPCGQVSIKGTVIFFVFFVSGVITLFSVFLTSFFNHGWGGCRALRNHFLVFEFCWLSTPIPTALLPMPLRSVSHGCISNGPVSALFVLHATNVCTTYTTRAAKNNTFKHCELKHELITSVWQIMLQVLRKQSDPIGCC